MKPIFEFHVSRQARQKYQFDETLFATDGRVVLSDFSAARRFTTQIYTASGRTIPASDIYALGLMDEILHLIIRQYEKQNPGVMTRALDSLQSNLGARFDETLFKFVDQFPPAAVYQGKQTVVDYLADSTSGINHKQISMEEMLLVNIINNNPAAQSYKELFDDSVLSQTAYIDSVSLLGNFFAKQLPMSSRGKGETLVEILTAPSKASPYSLEGQLQFLLDKWGDLLSEDLIRRILRAIDF
ncbi:MAG TPA: hypothetical protein VLX61_04995, partial [Anaerolineales bacterium]|nr:hypothetical protein [Anaerolineales bacterium]